jgi:hypothetical protein
MSEPPLVRLARIIKDVPLVLRVIAKIANLGAVAPASLFDFIGNLGFVGQKH